MFSQLLMNWRIFYIDHIIKLRFELQFFYVLFPGIGRVKKFLSLTCLHSWIFIRINIFNFKKQTNKQKNKTNKNTKKSKEIKEKKRITLENWFKKKQVKIFLLTRFSGNKSIFIGLMYGFFFYCHFLWMFWRE